MRKPGPYLRNGQYIAQKLDEEQFIIRGQTGSFQPVQALAVFNGRYTLHFAMLTASAMSVRQKGFNSKMHFHIRSA